MFRLGPFSLATSGLHRVQPHIAEPWPLAVLLARVALLSVATCELPFVLTGHASVPALLLAHHLLGALRVPAVPLLGPAVMARLPERLLEARGRDVLLILPFLLLAPTVLLEKT